MRGRVNGVGLVLLLLVGGFVILDSQPPVAAQTRPVKKPAPPGKRYRFVDEKEINKDWKLTGEWRIEGQGLRIYADKTTELESKQSYKGDLELTIEYEMNPRRELTVTAWGEQFDFRIEVSKTPKGNVPSTASLSRKGESVTFRTTTMHAQIVKLSESKLDKATPLVIRIDRKTTSKTARDMLIKSILIKAAEVDVAADP